MKRAMILGVLVAAACGSGSNADGGTPKRADGADDGEGACPSDQPTERASCSSSASCKYGSSTCCGVAYSAVTCTCQTGGFSCAMTVECNFVCPDAEPVDGAGPG